MQFNYKLCNRPRFENRIKFFYTRFFPAVCVTGAGAGVDHVYYSGKRNGESQIYLVVRIPPAGCMLR